MYNCTEAFLTKHVRNLDTGQVEDNFASVVQYSGIVLVARQEELGHNDPNTVMFMHPATLGAIRDAIGLLNPRQNRHFTIQVRIPWVVTWTGGTQFVVVENAAGFSGDTDAAGDCCHYSGVVTDGQSTTHHWTAPGLNGT